MPICSTCKKSLIFNFQPVLKLIVPIEYIIGNHLLRSSFKSLFPRTGKWVVACLTFYLLVQRCILKCQRYCLFHTFIKVSCILIWSSLPPSSTQYLGAPNLRVNYKNALRIKLGIKFWPMKCLLK